MLMGKILSWASLLVLVGLAGGAAGLSIATAPSSTVVLTAEDIPSYFGVQPIPLGRAAHVLETSISPSCPGKASAFGIGGHFSLGAIPGVQITDVTADCRTGTLADAAYQTLTSMLGAPESTPFGTPISVGSVGQRAVAFQADLFPARAFLVIWQTNVHVGVVTLVGPSSERWVSLDQAILLAQRQVIHL